MAKLLCIPFGALIWKEPQVVFAEGHRCICSLARHYVFSPLLVGLAGVRRIRKYASVTNGAFFIPEELRCLEKIPSMQYDDADLIQIAPGRSEPG